MTPCSYATLSQRPCGASRLCNKLDDAASLLDLTLSVFAEVSCAHNERDLWDATLAKDFAVAEWEEVEDGCGI